MHPFLLHTHRDGFLYHCWSCACLFAVQGAVVVLPVFCVILAGLRVILCWCGYPVSMPCTLVPVTCGGCAYLLQWCQSPSLATPESASHHCCPAQCLPLGSPTRERKEPLAVTARVSTLHHKTTHWCTATACTFTSNLRAGSRVTKLTMTKHRVQTQARETVAQYTAVDSKNTPKLLAACNFTPHEHCTSRHVQCRPAAVLIMQRSNRPK